MTTMSMQNRTSFDPRADLPTNDLFGYDATWTFSRFSIELPDLRQRFEDHGLDSSVLPKKIQTRSTVIRAIHDLEADGFVRRIKELEDKDKAVFVIADEVLGSVSGQVDVKFDIRNTFTYNKKAGVVVADDPAVQAKVAALMQKHATAMMANNMSIAIKKLVQRSQSLNWAKGMHFIPVQNVDTLNKLRRLFDTFGGSARLILRSVTSAGESRELNAAELFKSFEAEYISELEDMIKDTDDLYGSADDAERKKAVPGKSWLNRLDAFKLQRKKAEMFSQMLNFKSEEYVERIAAAEAKLKERLTSVG